MTKTEHYQLNQWEKTDRILREDFNEDNRKIEAALCSVPYTKIVKMELQEPTSATDLAVDNIDFTKYLKIELFLHCPDFTGSINIQVNHIAAGYRCGPISGSVSGSSSITTVLASLREYQSGVLLFYSPHPQGKVGCLSISSNGIDAYSGQQCVAPCTWSQLTSFNFTTYGVPFPAGSKFCLYGVKG